MIKDTGLKFGVCSFGTVSLTCLNLSLEYILVAKHEIQIYASWSAYTSWGDVYEFSIFLTFWYKNTFCRACMVILVQGVNFKALTCNFFNFEVLGLILGIGVF